MRTVAYAILVMALAACGEVKPPDTDPCDQPGVVCECTAATEATACAGAHRACNVTDTNKTCECVAGYVMGPSGCVWTGSIKDPGIASATTWTVGNGALLNTTAVGGVDPGEVSFVASALCGMGFVKQTFDMPTFAKAEPLVLELSYKNQIVNSPMGGSDGVPMGVSLSNGWASLPAFPDAIFHTVRVCLGEGGYAPAGTAGTGAPVTLQLGPFDRARGCPNTVITNFAIDHAAIVTANAGECGAMPGLAANSDAEGTGGWTFTTSGTGTSVGAFVAGIGEGGSRAARITLNQRCDSAAMATSISVPRVANPALDMFVGLSSGAFGSMAIGAAVFGIGQLPLPLPVAGMGNYHACLPPSLSGQATTINFSVRNVMGGSCADVLNYQLWADNVKVVDDPTCASSPNVSNPGFERTGVATGAFVSSGFSTTGPDGAVAIRSAAGQAHGGTSYLQIDSFVNCSSQGVTTLVTVPPASGAAGPALKFFAKASVNANATVTASTGPTRVTIAQGTPYQPYTLCLNPQAVGRPQSVTFQNPVIQTGVVCGSANAETLQIDDLEATTDASCPAM